MFGIPYVYTQSRILKVRLYTLSLTLSHDIRTIVGVREVIEGC